MICNTDKTCFKKSHFPFLNRMKTKRQKTYLVELASKNILDITYVILPDTILSLMVKAESI